ncbi:MAG: hypothetical protein MUO76_05555 [Anaerolineaceae bacterium]|nr:hypothetical protein [Anaerolineaceae bacterium]
MEKKIIWRYALAVQRIMDPEQLQEDGQLDHGYSVFKIRRYGVDYPGLADMDGRISDFRNPQKNTLQAASSPSTRSGFTVSPYNHTRGGSVYVQYAEYVLSDPPLLTWRLKRVRYGLGIKRIAVLTKGI